ncbi:MAG: oligosaccharide flippase family protein [Steroidobacteraceae bacterium]
MSGTSLKSRTIRAGVWSSLIGFAGTALRFGSSLVMTRLLYPEAFGVFAIASTVLVILTLLSDVGLKQFIVFRPRGNERRYLDTIWSMSALQGTLIAGIAATVAAVVKIGQVYGKFPADSVYAHPDLPLLVALTAISSLIAGFKSPKLALLERNLDLRRVAYIEVLSQLTGTLVTIGLAWLWRDVWSIVVGAWCAAAVSVLLSLFWLEGARGRMRWDAEVAREVIFYGRWILLSSATFVVAGNLDRLLLGVWVTPLLLGIYVLALNISSIVESIITRPFGQVAMPALSEVVRRGDGGLRKAYFKLRLPLDVVTLCAAGFFFAAAPTIIDILYDKRYAEAGRTLQVLSFSLLFVRYGVTATAHVSLGEPRTASISNVIKLCTVALAVPVGNAIGGYYGAVWAIALHMIPSTLYLMLKNRQRELNDFLFEARSLLLWPIGFGAGWLFNMIAWPILHKLGLR